MLGKTSRVLTSQGLRYGLSGNRVIKMATFNYFLLKEKSPAGNQRKENREIQLDLSRKINL